MRSYAPSQLSGDSRSAVLCAVPCRHLCQTRHHSYRLTARRAVLVRVQQKEKGYRSPKWEVAWNELVNKRDYSSTDPEDVQSQVDSGKAVLIDVRPRARHDAAHPLGSISIPLYQKTDLSKPGFQKYLKALALLANGVEPVEPNPDFMAELKQATGGKTPALFCETGGTLVPNASFPNGKVSRSLMAVFRAVESGEYPEVIHVKGGAYGWSRAQLPYSGYYDESLAGRTPSVVQK